MRSNAKKHSRNKSQHARNKLQCPNCDVITHKKGGLLGKKLIPITAKGKVHKGRCLSCDPFPSRKGSAAAAETTTIHRAQGHEASSNRRLSNESIRSNTCNNNRRNTNTNTTSSPPTAMVTLVDTTTRIPSTSRHTNRSIDGEREQNEIYHDSEENSNRGRNHGRRYSSDSRRREQQLSQPQQPPTQQQQQHYQQNKSPPFVEATVLNDDNNNVGTRDIEDNATITAGISPSPRVAPSRTSTRTSTSGVPQTLEVIRRGPPRSGSINSNSFGDDHSAMSAITMDIHLFQCFNGADASLEHDFNAVNDDLPPSTFYHRRPGPERVSGRNYYNRNHLNNTNIFSSNERRHSTGGDVDSYRRHHHRSLNNNSASSSNHSGLSRNSLNRIAYPSPPQTTAHNLSPPNEYGNRARKEIHSQPPTPLTEREGDYRPYIESSGENKVYHGDHGIFMNTTSISSKSDKNRTSKQEIDFRSDHNSNKRIRNHKAQIQPRRSSSMTNDNRRTWSKSNIAIDNNGHHDESQYIQNMLRQHYQRYHQTESNDRMDTIEQGHTVVSKAFVTPNSSASSSGPHFTTENVSGNLKKQSTKTIVKEEDVDDMPGILRCLNLEECNPDTRERALCKLLDFLQNTSPNCHGSDHDRQIREIILENEVIEAVTKSMWADMEIVEVQEAAMNVLLFIAASTDISYMSVGCDVEQRSNSSSGKACLLSQNESVCDSILFTMQNHAAIHGIQLKGSLIFASLAASSADNRNTGNNTDGSLSGAMAMILNAMSNHVDSRPIRKAGLQALHHQCLLSAYAEDNKRNFVETKLENGIPAIDLVFYAMEELQKDVVAMEWACQLCWCLTANASSLKQIEQASLHEGAITICQHYMTKPIGISLVEASVGMIANLAYLNEKRSEMINMGAVELVLDGLRYHDDNFGISYEAALALENFSLPPHSSDVTSMLLKSEAVSLLIKGLKIFLDYPDYVIQGLRALNGIAIRCDEAKGKIISIEILSVIDESARKHMSPDVFEICSMLIATLAMGKTASVGNFMIEHGVVDILLFALECSHDEKVQTAACLALRNLSHHAVKMNLLLKHGKTTKLVINAMDAHRNSVSMQTNGCCIFLNLLSTANENELDFNTKIVTTIAKAMQSHFESGDLLEVACGALWAILNRFDDIKVYVGNEAIDVVACAMVMHPGNTSTLEKACGLLSNLSSEASLAEAIAKAQGVSIISETMCNNASSISLLESGCLTVKNILLVCPSYARDGDVAISTIVMAMSENVRSASFIKEACNLLWVLASENEYIRSKVLSLDGISILMKCLEQNSNQPEVETSALGAFNQLAKVNNNIA